MRCRPGRRTVALTGVLALLLCGCSLAPDYQRPQVDIPAAYHEAGGFGQWKAAEPGDGKVRGKWWTIYGDASLDALIDAADGANPNIRIAAARYRQALALANASDAARYPSASIATGVSRTNRTGSAAPGTIGTNYNLGLSAAWELDLWARAGLQSDASLASAAAAASDLGAARLSIQATVAQGYFQLRVLDSQRRLLDDAVSAYERSLQLTRNRFQVGVASRSDIALAETQLHATRAQVADVQAQRAVLEHALAVLCGKAPADFNLAANPIAYTIKGEASVVLPDVPPGLPSSLLERRPDIAAVERRVAAANAGIGVSRAALFPSVSLTANGGYQSTGIGTWLTAPTRYWALGPAIVLPLIDGGLRRSQIDAAGAAYDESVASYRQIVLNGFQEVEDGLANLRYLALEGQSLDAAVRSALESLQQTENRYRAGTIDYLSVVTVQTTALSNQRAALAVLGRRLNASVALVRALGGDWSADFNAVATLSPTASGIATRDPAR